jgi:hypothetical protein
MKTAIKILFSAALAISTTVVAQSDPGSLPDAPSYQAANTDATEPSVPVADRAASPAQPVAAASTHESGAKGRMFGAGDKFGYYVSETYLNPSVFTAPAIRAGIRMAHPPGKGTTQYPSEWRQGAEAFGRNYGDAFAERVSFQTARFLTGVLTREDPRYIPSNSQNVLARSLHAIAFTFVDRSDAVHPMLAISNFVGAAATGFVGNAYLPSGFNDVTHAGQRATLQLGIAAGGNLFREFAPQMPRPMRTFFMLIAR